MKLKQSNKYKATSKGAPKMVPTPVFDKNNPDNYPTLIRYLEANGRVKHTTYATMMKARNLYFRGGSSESIAIELRIEPAIVDRWALCFSWDEERDRRLFEQFRKVNGVQRMYGEDLGKRHERIAGTIEQIAERRLHQSTNGKDPLNVKDLKGLTDVIKATQEIRRTVRGEKLAGNNQNTTNNTLIVVPGNLEKVSNAIIDALDRPKLTQSETKTIAVGMEEAIGHDTEYETVDRNSEESK